MDQKWLDIQHRGLWAYRQLTRQDEDCRGLNLALETAPGGTAQVDTVLSDCEVHTDWIEKIQEALPFLENAVHQNRQFILRQGETVPLEKAKRVSRESVEHLAKHSQLITSDPQQPERIYISENVDTYAIYENRFLYMLLRDLEDFAGARYQKIKALAAAFSSEIAFERQLTQGNRQIHFQLRYSERDRGQAVGRTRQALEGIRGILQAVEAMLRTELMKEVAMAPILKPPISRTNILLHDPNFRAALELYTYLSAYTGDGYTVSEQPLSQGNPGVSMAQQLCELVSITSYLSHSQALEQELEQRRKEALQEENQKKLEALRKKLGDVTPAAADYIQALEQQLGAAQEQSRQLEQEKSQRKAAQEQLAATQAQLRKAQEDSAKLNQRLEAKARENRELNRQNAEIRETAELRLRQAERQQENLRQSFEEKLEAQRGEFQQEYEALGEQIRLAGAMSRDLTRDTDGSKEAFSALEQEFAAFRRYYDRQWRLTKKQIRKEQLWKK